MLFYIAFFYSLSCIIFATSDQSKINFAEPQIPASFPSCANANFTSLFAKNTLCSKYFLIYVNSTSPALDTPPPITITDGSVITQRFANAYPKYLPNSSAISIASSSPSLTASNTVFALTSLFRKILALSSFARRFFVSLTIPVAEAYCSRQPKLPQPQLSVSS